MKARSGRLIYSFFEPIKLHKNFSIIMIVCAGISLAVGVYSGIYFNNGSILVNFSNVYYVKYLSGSSGFASLFFSTFFTLLLFSLIIVLTGGKKYLMPIGIIFYLYFVYVQFTTITSIMLVYGVLNTLLVAILLIVNTLLYVLLMLIILVLCLEEQRNNCYFQNIWKVVLPVAVLLCVCCFVGSLSVLILKNFIIILVY